MGAELQTQDYIRVRIGYKSVQKRLTMLPLARLCACRDHRDRDRIITDVEEQCKTPLRSHPRQKPLGPSPELLVVMPSSA
jgi:hypothetical protein